MGSLDADECEHVDGEARDSLSDLRDGDRSRPVWLQPGTALPERCGLLPLAVEGAGNLKQARVAPSVEGAGRSKVGSNREKVNAAHRQGEDGAHSGAAATAHFGGQVAAHESLGVQGMTGGKTQDGRRKLSAGRQRDRNGVVVTPSAGKGVMPDPGDGKWQRSPQAAPHGTSSRDPVLPLCSPLARVGSRLEMRLCGPWRVPPAAALTTQTQSAVVRGSRIHPAPPLPVAIPLTRHRCGGADA
jgi:hypothetical protein